MLSLMLEKSLFLTCSAPARCDGLFTEQRSASLTQRLQGIGTGCAGARLWGWDSRRSEGQQSPRSLLLYWAPFLNSQRMF